MEDLAQWRSNEPRSIRLPKAGLILDDSRLVRLLPGGSSIDHDLRRVVDLAFRRRTNPWVPAFSVIKISIGIFCKVFVPIPWLSWLLFFMLVGSGLFILLGARNETVEFSEEGERFRYWLIGFPEQVAAFKAEITRALNVSDA